MKISIAPKRIISALRRAISGLVFASGSVFLIPNALAQDTVYIHSMACPDTILVTDVGELASPFNRVTPYGELLFSHFAEMVHFLSGPDMQTKLYVDVSYANPLRTLKRGNRLERTGGCLSSNGYYLFSAAVITGP